MVKQEEEIVESLSARCLQSFRAFHIQRILNYEDSKDDNSFEAMKILEVVPEHIKKLSRENNSETLKRKKKNQYSGTQGLKALTPKAL